MCIQFQRFTFFFSDPRLVLPEPGLLGKAALDLLLTFATADEAYENKAFF